MTELHWKTGFEIELLAPPGKTRRDLAAVLADRAGGHVRRIFYPQSEPSEVPGMPVFENLTLGFDAYDRDDRLIARCVDDLTLQADLDRQKPSLPGWYRIVSDDARLIHLIMAQCDAEAGLQDVLQPAARLFGTELANEAADVVRLADAMTAPVALVTGLPGERERPCELITPPLESNHRQRLDALLAAAREKEFRVPKEAAVHIHFDADKLCHPAVFARLVRVTSVHGKALRRLVGTNPHCRRLASTPKALRRATEKPSFLDRDWTSACEVLSEQRLSKYCDFNFLNIVKDVPGKSTFEVRILPGSLDTDAIIDQAVLFEAILDWCVTAPAGSSPETACRGSSSSWGSSRPGKRGFTERIGNPTASREVSRFPRRLGHAHRQGLTVSTYFPPCTTT